MHKACACVSKNAQSAWLSLDTAQEGLVPKVEMTETLAPLGPLAALQDK